VLAGGHEVAGIIKDGEIVDLGDRAREPRPVTFTT